LRNGQTERPRKKRLGVSGCISRAKPQVARERVAKDTEIAIMILMLLTDHLTSGIVITFALITRRKQHDLWNTSEATPTAASLILLMAHSLALLIDVIESGEVSFCSLTFPSLAHLEIHDSHDYLVRKLLGRLGASEIYSLDDDQRVVVPYHLPLSDNSFEAELS
jgi:hypothetical protein